ncbi:hypothetical protein ACHAXT_003285 [Thalassiosira profunda]
MPLRANPSVGLRSIAVKSRLLLHRVPYCPCPGSYQKLNRPSRVKCCTLTSERIFAWSCFVCWLTASFSRSTSQFGGLSSMPA